MRNLSFGSVLLVVLCCGFVFAGFNFGVVQGAQNVSGVLSENTTWTKTGSPYTLTANVLVSNGITLTIESGVTVNLNGYLLMVNGTLNARGTSADKILFNGGGTITFTSYSVAWNEATASGSIIEYATLGAARVTMTGANPKINSNTLESIDLGGLAIFSNNVVSTITISGSPTVTGNTITGELQVNSDAATPIISYNTLSGGIYVAYSAGAPVISHNTITGGIEVANEARNAIIDSNSISGGLIINSGAATVSGNTITGGIKTSSDAISILYNSLSSSNIGIEFAPYGIADYLNGSIIGNTITAAQTGISVPPSFSAFIYGYSTTALIVNNTIHGCATAGVSVGGGSGSGGQYPLNNVTILDNLLYGNGYAIKTEHPNRIEGNTAINNYWAINGGGIIRNNVVSTNTYGISGGTVENNFVANNQYGVTGSNIKNNTIINNNLGVYGAFQNLNFNNLYGNTLNVNYNSTTDANATLNWWGTTDSQAIAASIYDYNEDFLLGRVNYTPYLTALNTQAPAPDTPIIPELPTAEAILALLVLAAAAVVVVRIRTKR